jgi:hypothetical protein
VFGLFTPENFVLSLEALADNLDIPSYDLSTGITRFANSSESFSDIFVAHLHTMVEWLGSSSLRRSECADALLRTVQTDSIELVFNAVKHLFETTLDPPAILVRYLVWLFDTFSLLPADVLRVLDPVLEANPDRLDVRAVYKTCGSHQPLLCDLNRINFDGPDLAKLRLILHELAGSPVEVTEAVCADERWAGVLNILSQGPVEDCMIVFQRELPGADELLLALEGRFAAAAEPPPAAWSLFDFAKLESEDERAFFLALVAYLDAGVVRDWFEREALPRLKVLEECDEEGLLLWKRVALLFDAGDEIAQEFGQALTEEPYAALGESAGRASCPWAAKLSATIQGLAAGP